MKEIKFRAWNEYRKEYSYHDSPYWMDEYGTLTFEGCLDSPFDLLEQYTGLKDKNSKEIYEGDIVRSCNGGKHFWEYEIKSIGGQFGNCLFAILLKDNITSSEDDNYYIYEETTERAGNRSYVPNGKDVEIIGNIHERES